MTIIWTSFMMLLWFFFYGTKLHEGEQMTTSELKHFFSHFYD